MNQVYAKRKMKGGRRQTITISELQKMIDADQQQQQEDQPEMQTLKARLKDKQFWMWFSEKHKEQSRANNLNTHGLC